MNGRMPARLIHIAFALAVLSLLVNVPVVLPVLEAYAATSLFKPWKPTRLQNTQKTQSGKTAPSPLDESLKRHEQKAGSPPPKDKYVVLEGHARSSVRGFDLPPSTQLAPSHSDASHIADPTQSNSVSNSIQKKETADAQRSRSEPPQKLPLDLQKDTAPQYSPFGTERRGDVLQRPRHQPPSTLSDAISSSTLPKDILSTAQTPMVVSSPTHEHSQPLTVLEMAETYKDEGLTTILKALGSPPTAMELLASKSMEDLPKWNLSK